MAASPGRDPQHIIVCFEILMCEAALREDKASESTVGHAFVARQDAASMQCRKRIGGCSQWRKVSNSFSVYTLEQEFSNVVILQPLKRQMNFYDSLHE